MLRTIRALVIAGMALAAAGAAACSSGTGTAQPSAVVGAPSAISPAANAQIGFASQPVTLTVANATVTGAAAATATYAFEVASDSAFANKVQTKTAAPGASGQTSVTLDSLTAGKDYYWHVHVQVGSTFGPFTDALKFTLVPFTAPAPIGPASGATYTAWPTLMVANVEKSGTTGPVAYLFEVSTSNSFSAIVASATVSEGSGQTSYTPTLVISSPTTLFWRVTATDQGSGISSAPSDTQTFTLALSQAGRIAAQENVALWPGQQPPGAAGRATLGDSWNVQNTISISGVAHITPTLEELRVFDCLDHGMDPDSAIAWINSHGYHTVAAYYAGPAVIGFAFEYMAYIRGRWDLIFKAE